MVRMNYRNADPLQTLSLKRLESGQRAHSLPTEHIINRFWVTSFSIEITDTLLPCERAIQ